MRIVIIEDEIRIREGIEKLIYRISEEHEIVGCAEDGEEGVRLVMETTPDLIITDIRMPKMDGLEMLSLLKEKKKLPKVIVLSAYSQFEYARQALKLGVSEYILKPIAVAEFTNSFKGVEHQINLENEREKLLTRNESFDAIMEQELYYGETVNMHLKETLREKYQFDVEAAFCIVPVYMGDDFEKNKKSVSRELQSLLNGCEMSAARILELAKEKLFLIFLYNYSSEKQLERWFQNRITMHFLADIREQVCFGWTEVDSINKLKCAYKEVCKALEWNIVLGSGVIVSYPKVEAIQATPVTYPISIEQDIRESLCTMNVKKIEEKEKSFINYFRCSGIIYSPQEVKSSFVRFVWSIFNVIKEINIICYKKFQQQLILDNLMTAVTFKELETVLRGIINMINEHGFREVQSGDSLLIQRIKSLVHEFYNRGITLDEIAEELQMTPEYLGTQFHKEVGITYSTYLKNYRVGKAKKLLLGTDLKTYQIAQQVGYNDPKYFSKVFKETEGVLPGVYRKTH